MKPPIHLLKISEDKSTPLGFTVEIEPEFEQWFVKSQNLEEWDDSAFTLWFKTFLSDAMRDRVGQRFSEQQKVDVWSREGLEE